ncbi:MAG: WbqC family protein [Flavobacteriales bacterium]|nr:WbqC family protein [Flavobacteriales bacterium]
MENNNLFPLFYLGNIEYYAEIAKHKAIVFEQHEHFPKQTYRSRCEILGPNGKLKLVLPLAKPNSRQVVKSVQLSTTDNWQKIHWKSLESAYRSSPYFEYYEHEFYPFFHTQQHSLFSFNLELHQLILQLLQIDIDYTLSTKYKPTLGKDYRTFFNSKKESANTKLKENTYIQVFNDRMEFQPNISVVDLLFNEGPNSLTYLRDIT